LAEVLLNDIGEVTAAIIEYFYVEVVDVLVLTKANVIGNAKTNDFATTSGKLDFWVTNEVAGYGE
jgi:hypothetical protein